MASRTIPMSLSASLEQNCQKICKPKSTVLFNCGEKAFGIFLVLSGRVSLNLGNDKSLDRYYGPGALLGLPATLTRRDYSMTATVAEDAELGFLPPEVLDSLMRDSPDLCRELLTVLSERMVEIQQLQKALLSKQRRSSPQSPGSTMPEEDYVY